MCGRFTLTSPTDELAGYFNVLVKTQLAPRYNIAPTQPVVCVRTASHSGADAGLPDARATDSDPASATVSDAASAVVSGAGATVPGTNAAPGFPSGAREMVEMRWGLIPYWAKDPAIGSRMINARSESVAEKPAYRDAFRRRRCLVVADGFYEWKRLPGGKQPYFIHMRDRRPFAFAGLWERWKPRAGQLDKIAAPGKPRVPMSEDGRLESCSFLTIGPNELMEPIHDRMPVILAPEHWDTWLDPANDEAEGLAALLLPFPADEMRAHPVSTHVNKPANDDPSCIEPMPRLKIVRPGSEGATGDASESVGSAKANGDIERPPTQDSLF